MEGASAGASNRALPVPIWTAPVEMLLHLSFMKVANYGDCSRRSPKITDSYICSSESMYVGAYSQLKFLRPAFKK
jgi:hypothetical protein